MSKIDSDLYRIIHDFSIMAPKYIGAYAMALSDIESATTPMELAKAMDREKEARAPALAASNSYAEFLRIFDPLEYFASEEHEALVQDLVAALAEAAIKNKTSGGDTSND
ncbi:hypothetical protein P4C99_20135 [Pontiellaceae bacterium B1224]|nr:hypothetical protein [Pontiellaceae bacterium B1224]